MSSNNGVNWTYAGFRSCGLMFAVRGDNITQGQVMTGFSFQLIAAQNWTAAGLAQ
ncbi:MAG: hypothetical protein IPL53_15095 [Ignavibacteria bacterium]|nr:hypothetical protein [Ignavibacteria bacterium]